MDPKALIMLFDTIGYLDVNMQTQVPTTTLGFWYFEVTCWKIKFDASLLLPICWLMGRQDCYHVVVITINRALVF
jgi:hypothetical protein